MAHTKKSHEKYLKREGKSSSFVKGHDEKVGHRDFANLPSDVIMKEFPKPHQMRGGMLDDTITGIDNVMSNSESMTLRHLSNQK